MQGVTSHVYVPKSNTTCTMALKKKPDTRGSVPYLLSILIILFHTSLAREKFLSTFVKPLFAADITCPRYRKEVTISKGLP